MAAPGAPKRLLVTSKSHRRFDVSRVSRRTPLGSPGASINEGKDMMPRVHCRVMRIDAVLLRCP